jgi:hypothetical protein
VRECIKSNSCEEVKKGIIEVVQNGDDQDFTVTPYTGIWGPEVVHCEGDDQRSVEYEDELSMDHGMSEVEAISEGYDEPFDPNAQYDPASEHYNSSAIHLNQPGAADHQFEEQFGELRAVLQ